MLDNESKNNERKKEIPWAAIITAAFGALGVIATAYIGYLQARLPIVATQTSEAARSTLQILRATLPSTETSTTVAPTHLLVTQTLFTQPAPTNTPKPSCLILPSGLVSWWPGDGNANDIIGDNDGLLQHGAGISAEGKVGQAFTFDGIDDAILIENSVDLKSFSVGLTIGAWINPREVSASSGNAVFSKWGQICSDDAYLLAIDKIDDIVRIVGAIGAPPRCDVHALTGGNISLNTWTHVAMTYDVRSGINAIYINGESVDKRIHDGGIIPSDLSVYIGKEDSYLNRFFDGSIDEILVFNRVLAESDLQAIVEADEEGRCKVPGD